MQHSKTIFSFVLLLIIHYTNSIAQDANQVYYVNKYFEKTDSASANYIVKPKLHKNETTIVSICTLQGLLIAEQEYKNNHISVLHGISQTFYASGKIKSRISYANGKLHGDIITYYPNGSLKRKDEYRNNKFIQGNCYGNFNNKIIHTPYIQNATFIGGDKELYKLIYFNSQYPPELKELKITGNVIIRLYIQKNGTIEKYIVEKSLHPLLDTEAMEVASLISKYNPQLIDNEAIDSIFLLEIPFEIIEK